MDLHFFQITVSDSIYSLVPGQREYHTRMYIGSGIKIQNMKIGKKEKVKCVLSHFPKAICAGGVELLAGLQ